MDPLDKRSTIGSIDERSPGPAFLDGLCQNESSRRVRRQTSGTRSETEQCLWRFYCVCDVFSYVSFRVFSVATRNIFLTSAFFCLVWRFKARSKVPSTGNKKKKRYFCMGDNLDACFRRTRVVHKNMSTSLDSTLNHCTSNALIVKVETGDTNVKNLHVLFDFYGFVYLMDTGRYSRCQMSDVLHFQDEVLI